MPSLFAVMREDQWRAEDRIKELEEENKQLKSRIKELKKLIVDINPDYYEELYGDVE